MWIHLQRRGIATTCLTVEQSIRVTGWRGGDTTGRYRITRPVIRTRCAQRIWWTASSESPPLTADEDRCGGLNRPGFAGGSSYWISTRAWSVRDAS
jgi:hypothetical protein